MEIYHTYEYVIDWTKWINDFGQTSHILDNIDNRDIPNQECGTEIVCIALLLIDIIGLITTLRCRTPHPLITQWDLCVLGIFVMI